MWWSAAVFLGKDTACSGVIKFPRVEGFMACYSVFQAQVTLCLDRAETAMLSLSNVSV